MLMARLRKGRANTARGAAHFLRETVGRVRYAGANNSRCGLTAASTPTPSSPSAATGCALLHHRPPARPLRNIIEAIPEQDWTPIPYWMDGAADVAETTYVPFQNEPDAAPVRLIVRRVKPTHGSQLALFSSYSYHGFITDRYGDTLDASRPTTGATPRSRTPSETSSTASGSTISPRAASPPILSLPPGWRCR